MARRNQFTPSFEALEARELMTANVVAHFLPATGTLLVHGNRGNDNIRIEQRTDLTGNQLQGVQGAWLTVVDGWERVNIRDNNLTYSAVQSDLVRHIEVWGGEGNDSITLDIPRVNAALDAAVWGQDGDDVLALTQRTSDNLSVNFLGGLGNDRASVNDNPANRLSGGEGDDILTGGGFLSGDAGNDTLQGGRGADLLRGGAGNDSLNGLAGNDTLEGETGDDSLDGDAGDDALNGGAGNDVLVGGAGNDTLKGEAGNDQLFGDYKDDFAAQRTVMVWKAAPRRPFAWDDRRPLGQWVQTTQQDPRFGTEGNDLLFGVAGNDTLQGGRGNDALFGGAGSDKLNAGEGANFLDDGDGNRGLKAGANDTVATTWATKSDADRPFAAEPTDVIQAAEAGTCWGLASLIAVSYKTDLAFGKVGGKARVQYKGDGVYQVQLYSAKQGRWITQEVEYYGQATETDPAVNRNDFWVPLYQRALLQEAGVDWRNQGLVKELHFQASFALTALTGLATSPQTDRWEELKATLIQNGMAMDSGSMDLFRSVVADTPKAGSHPQLVANHSYAVVYYDAEADQVVLRNPWGVDGGSVGSDDPTDGVIFLTWAEFQQSFVRFAAAGRDSR